MKYLKQSTSAVIVFGPALLPSDGVTLVTSLVSALDHATTGIFINKNGGSGAVRHATVTATTYDAYGHYLVTLDTTDTNTLGRLRVSFAAAASCLPVWEEFTVLAANVYDALIGASVNLKVDLDTIKTQTVTCAAGVTVPATIASATNITGGTITTVTNLTNAPTAGDLTAAMKASVGVAVVDQALSGHTTAGSVGASLPAGPPMIKKNQALAAFSFPMFDTTGAPRTGLTVTSQRSIDGGSFASCTNSAAEIGNGWYKIALSAADLNGDCIAFRFSSLGVQDTDVTIVTQP